MLTTKKGSVIMSSSGSWWVNHRQTFRQEFEGGYIWSPKKNSNGARNQTYLNLREVRPGDTIYSYADGVIGAVGVIVSTYEECPKPSEFGNTVGSNWDDFGWKVEVEWVRLATPLRPRANIKQIAPMLPTRNSPIQTNGNGNQGCYLASITEDLNVLLRQLIAEAGNIGIDGLLNALKVDVTGNDPLTNVVQAPKATYTHDADAGAEGDTEISQVVKSRKGQGVFRLRVIEVEGLCRVTGLDVPELLIASHIKPWSVSSNAERLDGNNGLLLSPHVDKLFDRGLISFEDDGRLLVAESCIPVLLNWHIDPDMNVGVFNARQKGYLKYHRKHIYKG